MSGKGTDRSALQSHIDKSFIGWSLPAGMYSSGAAALTGRLGNAGEFPQAVGAGDRSGQTRRVGQVGLRPEVLRST